MAFSVKQNLENNIKAIILAFDLKTNNRIPNEEESATLKKYVGFGGIKEILLDYNDPQVWTKQSLTLLPLVKNLYDVLDSNIQDERLREQVIRNMRSSILSAFYTPSEICEAISKSIADLNMPIKTVLEPSAGIGSILGSLKENLNLVMIKK